MKCPPHAADLKLILGHPAVKEGTLTTGRSDAVESLHTSEPQLPVLTSLEPSAGAELCTREADLNLKIRVKSISLLSKETESHADKVETSHHQQFVN